MKIIIDSREQCPYSFKGVHYADVLSERGTLATGDYSLSGLTDKVAIERKSLADLMGCLTKDRQRFKAELLRGRGLDFFAVVVEASWADLSAGDFKSRMNPHAACQSVASMMIKYGCPFLFCLSRTGAEYMCWSLLRQYLQGSLKRLKAIANAHDIEQGVN